MLLILCAIWLAGLDKAGMYSVGPMHIYCDTPKELAFTSFSNNTAIACAEEVYKKCTGSNSHTSCLVVELLLFGLMAGIDIKTSMTSCNRSTNNVADLLYLSIQALHIWKFTRSAQANSLAYQFLFHIACVVDRNIRWTRLMYYHSKQ